MHCARRTTRLCFRCLCCSCKIKGGEAVWRGPWAICLAISLDYVSKSSVSKATTRLRQVRYAYLATCDAPCTTSINRLCKPFYSRSPCSRIRRIKYALSRGHIQPLIWQATSFGAATQHTTSCQVQEFAIGQRDPCASGTLGSQIVSLLPTPLS